MSSLLVKPIRRKDRQRSNDATNEIVVCVPFVDYVSLSYIASARYTGVAAMAVLNVQRAVVT